MGLVSRQRAIFILVFGLALAGCGSSPSAPATLAPATPAPATLAPATLAPATLALPTEVLPTPQLARSEEQAADLELIPLLAARQRAIIQSLQQEPPILLLDLPAEDPRARSQQLAIADQTFIRYVREEGGGRPLRSEIFGVYPWRASDTSAATARCTGERCYRVEMYNYALNLTTVAAVDLEEERVLEVVLYPDSQPELPPALAELAVQIALASPQVRQAVGDSPGEALMATTKTALKNTTCEHSNHLCVAPTILLEDRRWALWAIVDLTAAQLVGIQWTHLGASSGQWPERPTEDQLRKQVVFSQYCQQANRVEQDGWKVPYIITSSDGLEIFDVTFAGQPVLDSAKLVDWHVQYSKSEGFGYNDGIGCPMFSSSAVVAVEGPHLEELPTAGGFALVQDFYHPLWPQPCNYRYQQRYEFFLDGSFRVVALNLGRGCGIDGVYRPVVRIDLASRVPGGQQLSEWDGQQWQLWGAEGWRLQDGSTSYTAEGYQLRMTDRTGAGYFLEPGRGQFGDGGRGDNAFVYVTVVRPGEGDADMPTLGSCCGEGHRQGPEQFMEPSAEALTGQDLLLWYVPQLENDERPGQEYCWADFVWTDGLYVPTGFPCAAGPRFVPVSP